MELSEQSIGELVAAEVSRQLALRANRPVYVTLDPGAKVPHRYHDTDAGADVFAPNDFTVPVGGTYFLKSGVHVQLPRGTRLDIREKSGLHKDHGVFTMGLVDEGYTGDVGIIIHNVGNAPIAFKAGDEVCQFVVSEVMYPDFVVVDSIEGGERGDGAYGSTGR